MRNDRNWSIIRTISLCVQLLAEVVAVIVVLQLNMLPGKYIALFIGVMVILAAGSTLLMFIHVKERIALWRRITSCVLAGLVLCGCVFVSKVAYDAYQLVSGVTGGESGTRSTYVLVLNEDKAYAVEDTKGYRFGAVENYDVEHTQQMVALIEKETAQTPAVTNYPQASLMADALYSGDVDALIMNDASISLLLEQPKYSDFLNRVRLIFTMTHENSSSGESAENKELVSTPFFVYISGSDTRSKLLDVSRSDVNILAVVHPETKQILLINTPRDYYVPNPAGKDKLDKLTHCGLYGAENSMKTLSTLYNVEIDHYGKINFTGFEKLIDAIGGVTVYSDEAFTAQDYYIKKGDNQLNGEQALKFARERHNVSGGDNGRGKNQMKVIKAVVEKLASSKALISNYADILKSLEGMFSSDFSSEAISDLVKMQLADMATWNVQSFAVTGKGGFAETYSAPGEDLYVMWPNEDAVAYASALIQRVVDGEILTSADMVMPK